MGKYPVSGAVGGARGEGKNVKILVVAARRLMLVVALSLILGACMSSQSGKNDPLPVKSRDEVLSWAEQIVRHAAQGAGIEVASEPARQNFVSCVGKNGESAPDGRYTLTYAAYSNVPRSRHPEVVRAVRSLFEKEGLAVTGYREARDGEAESSVSLRHPESRYVVDVSAVGENRMVMVVVTPCLMPPSGP